MSEPRHPKYMAENADPEVVRTPVNRVQCQGYMHYKVTLSFYFPYL